MNRVIDVRANVGPHVTAMRRAGVNTVIRHCCGSTGQTDQDISADEAALIAGEGLNLGLVCPVGDPRKALETARLLRQPRASAIYFSSDATNGTPATPSTLAARFKDIKEMLGNRFLVGAIGSSDACEALLRAKLVDHVWLQEQDCSSEHTTFLSSQRWSLWQLAPRIWPGLGFEYSPVMSNPAEHDFGQFSLQYRAPYLAEIKSENIDPVFVISSRDGACLRCGPGVDFVGRETLAFGAYVFVKDTRNGWAKVDVIGDRRYDGYVVAGDIEPVLGGVQLDYPIGATPFDVAKIELAFDQQNVRNGRLNPRIFNFHATISSGGRDPVDWASSFVNFCVRAAGFLGTDSKWALSWHDSFWGWDVTDQAERGDISVWECRKGGKSGAVIGGFVGFVVDVHDDQVMVLGAHSSGRIRIVKLPMCGLSHGMYYRLRSFRRAIAT